MKKELIEAAVAQELRASILQGGTQKRKDNDRNQTNTESETRDRRDQRNSQNTSIWNRSSSTRTHNHSNANSTPIGSRTDESRCIKCGQTGHLAATCTNPRRPAHPSTMCYGCGERGHYKPECPHPERHNAADTERRRAEDEARRAVKFGKSENDPTRS